MVVSKSEELVIWGVGWAFILLLLTIMRSGPTNHWKERERGGVRVICDEEEENASARIPRGRLKWEYNKKHYDALVSEKDEFLSKYPDYDLDAFDFFGYWIWLYYFSRFQEVFVLLEDYERELDGRELDYNHEVQLARKERILNILIVYNSAQNFTAMSTIYLAMGVPGGSLFMMLHNLILLYPVWLRVERNSRQRASENMCVVCLSVPIGLFYFGLMGMPSLILFFFLAAFTPNSGDFHVLIMYVYSCLTTFTLGFGYFAFCLGQSEYKLHTNVPEPEEEDWDIVPGLGGGEGVTEGSIGRKGPQNPPQEIVISPNSRGTTPRPTLSLQSPRHPSLNESGSKDFYGTLPVRTDTRPIVHLYKSLFKYPCNQLRNSTYLERATEPYELSSSNFQPPSAATTMTKIIKDKAAELRVNVNR